MRATVSETTVHVKSVYEIQAIKSREGTKDRRRGQDDASFKMARSRSSVPAKIGFRFPRGRGYFQPFDDLHLSLGSSGFHLIGSQTTWHRINSIFGAIIDIDVTLGGESLNLWK